MSAAVVIPARYASTRLPGKPLLKRTGRYLIQHVYERACEAKKADTVIVATDDARIFTAVESFGGRAVLTRNDHPSGTDRIAEVMRSLPHDIVVNLQGDEPLTDPTTIDLLVARLENDPAAKMATLACPIASGEQWVNPNCVKVVVDASDIALYFSRSPIPFVRDGQPDFAARPARFLLHVGMYAYRRGFLFEYAAASPAPLEQLEKLEQLRALAMGVRIGVARVERAALGVDTPEDYDRFVQIVARAAPRAA